MISDADPGSRAGQARDIMKYLVLNVGVPTTALVVLFVVVRQLMLSRGIYGQFDLLVISLLAGSIVSILVRAYFNFPKPVTAPDSSDAE